MRRGDIVIVAAQGDHGKPRPALIVQTDLAPETTLVAVLPLTSDVVDAQFGRIPIRPTSATGLNALSFVMVDRISTVRRDKVGGVIGRAEAATITEINRALAVFIGLA